MSQDPTSVRRRWVLSAAPVEVLEVSVLVEVPDQAASAPAADQALAPELVSVLVLVLVLVLVSAPASALAAVPALEPVSALGSGPAPEQVSGLALDSASGRERAPD